MPNDQEPFNIYNNWLAAAEHQQALYPLAYPGKETQQRFRELLGFCMEPETPSDVRLERTWEAGGLVGEEISWSVGYGPRTQAWVLKPAGDNGLLPGVLALHDHGSFKFYGKEKIADGPEGEIQAVTPIRKGCYGGRAFANVLARAGFVVLIHDVFLWGSRRWPLDEMPDFPRSIAKTYLSWWDLDPIPAEINHYNAATELHEPIVEQYCAMLGTTLAGVVAHEDRVAVNYLCARPDVAPSGVGCVGLSGGGARAVLLQATCDSIAATVVAGMMSTYRGLLFRNLSHTFMLFPPGLARCGDWPDLAACRAPSPLLVQYDRDDKLFSMEGMQAADQRIARLYQHVGRSEAYTGQFYSGPHKFDLEMQAAAFDWLKKQLLGR